MGIFSGINTAATGLTAQRLRLDIISENIANAESTRRADADGPYLRKRVIFSPMVSQPYWRSPFLPSLLDNGVGKGVRVSTIEEDRDAETRLVYDPTHPDAIQFGERKGYVEYPNVNIVNEMVDMIAASRSYEANIAVINGSKSMFAKALEIGR